MGSNLHNPEHANRAKSDDFRFQLQRMEAEIGKVIIGQPEMIQTLFCALLARGHVLLEGVPGLAKSLTVATFARLIGGTFKRIQFTPDKLPGDITGTTVYNQATATFSFSQGPVFCNILLADEINRAAPKVQSALLEAMQEKVVSVDRDQHPLPDLFMVLATMNPVEQLGTYPLSEAQLDRFIAKVELSYPQEKDEALLLHKKGGDFDRLQQAVPQLLSIEQALAMQQHVAAEVTISDPVIAYLLDICRGTRPQSPDAVEAVRNYVAVGVSPRGGEHLIAFCKGQAFMQGRNFVSFEDIDACAPAVLGHRLILSDAAFLEGIRPDDLLKEVIAGIVPY